MCGITGILKSNNIPPDSILLNKMIHLIRHRGPDESGLYLDNRVGLAHARLSVIDLSEGTQPIHNENKSLWIILNGEIFNYPELRGELVKSGHDFYTKTDTEVILHLYEEEGADCLTKLNGQFAFAIWDTNKQTLFLARDRVGILTLFYSIRPDSFVFASEIKSLFADPSITRNINYKALDQIFTYWTTLPQISFFDNIYELPPAHYMLVTPEGHKIERYWNLDFCSAGNYTDFTEHELIGKVDEILLDAVRLRLRADVPVGSYLSGGLDSSGITSIIKKNFNNRLSSFGIRFEDEDFDEGIFQEEMVRFLNLNHFEFLIRNEDIGANLESALWYIEKPILRTAPVPLFLLSSLVHKSEYKVVLTGEGADEIFGGYNIFKETKIRNFWSRYPDSKTRPLLLGTIYPYIFKDKKLGNTLIEFFRSGIDNPGNPLFSHLVRWNNTSKIKNFFSDNIKAALNGYDTYSDLISALPEKFHEWDYFAKAQYLEIIIFMSNYLLLSQGDRMAMANSVEIRVPFLDHRIIELMSKVDPELKIKGLNEKYILKEVLKDKLPLSIIKRPKNPYRAPIKGGLLNADSELIARYLSESELKKSDLFDTKKVELFLKKIYKLEKISEIDGMTLIGLLSTQIIYDRFINNFETDTSNLRKFNLIFDMRSC